MRNRWTQTRIDYHPCITSEPTEEFEKQLTYLGGNTEKYTSLTVPIEKEVARIEKKVEKELQKLYPTD